jgi:type II secretory pathway pseudopilin PulG
MRTQRFNLVEIVIALGIVAIGVTAVMGFLPMGLNASRDAIADNYAADSGDQLLHYLSSTIQEDWSQLDDFDSVPPNVAAGSGDLSTWTVIPGTNIYTKVYASKTVYRILQQTDDIAGVGTTVVDFDAMVRIWKTATAASEYKGGVWVTTTDSDYGKRALLNLEITWPAAVNFGARRKTYYALEVNKP